MQNRRVSSSPLKLPLFERAKAGTPAKHHLTVALTFDFDAESYWVGTVQMKSPSAISRGTYGAVEGLPRILKLLQEYDLPATFFVPGYTAEQHPEALRAIAAAGHEIGHHGYLHEAPNFLEPEEEKRILSKGIDILEKMTGKRPVGYRSPSAELSPVSLDLLVEAGFLYDSSLLGADRPYWAPGHEQQKDLLEIPIAIELTDSTHFMFLYTPIVLPGLSAPSKVGEIWQGDFDGLYAERGDTVFLITCHPQVIGRPHRMQMLERLIIHILQHEGIWFAQMREITQLYHDPKSNATSRTSK